MFNQTRKSLLLIVTLLFSLSILLPAQVAEAAGEDRFLQIQEIYENLLQYHVDSPNSKQLVDGAIKGMIQSLNDPYTTYLTEEEFASFMNSIDGSFIGIGIYLELTEKGIVVQGVIPNGPAEKAGMKSGDLITHVNGTKLKGEQLEEAQKQILGKEGTEVKVTVTRVENNQSQSITFTMKREKITLPNVEMAMLANNVGYLKLHRFGTDTAELTKQSLERLEKLGMNQLILDLRGNPGGLLDVAVQIASLFKENSTALHVKDNTGKMTPITYRGGQNFTKPLVVLIDKGSASASEILAGFLQEQVQATVIGQQSFGKGTVQQLIGLETGGVLKITVNEYFTPKLKQVNKKGITPAILVEQPEFQLAKAFGYLTKRQELKITAQGDILLNGLKDATYSVKAVQRNGQWYLPLRVITDWYDGSITWNGKKKSIDVQLAKQTYRVAQGDPALYVEAGRSYLSLDFLAKELPFNIEKKDGEVIISK